MRTFKAGGDRPLERREALEALLDMCATGAFCVQLALVAANTILGRARRPGDPLAGYSAERAPRDGLASRQRRFGSRRGGPPRGGATRALCGSCGPRGPRGAPLRCVRRARGQQRYGTALPVAQGRARVGRRAALTHSGRPPRGWVFYTAVRNHPRHHVRTMELSPPVESANDGRRHRGARPPRRCGEEAAPRERRATTRDRPLPPAWLR
jgi:hypothetical protein